MVYYGAAVMLFCRDAVNSKTAALQHRYTKNGTLPLAHQDFNIRIYLIILSIRCIHELRRVKS